LCDDHDDAELSGQEITSVTEEKSISHYKLKQQMICMDLKIKSGNAKGCWRTPINLYLKKNISAFCLVTYYRNFCRLYQQDHPSAEHHSCTFQLILVH
jgi:hypothetical protein